MAKNEVRIRITGDAAQLGSALQGASDEVEGFAASFKSKFGALSVAAGNLLASGITSALSGASGFLRDSIGAASDMGETVSKIGVLFGDQAEAIKRFADSSATQFGQSKQQALDAAATFAVFGKSAGLSGEKLTEFSTSFVGLASDLASFHNASPEETIEAIGAALRGEAEPMRRFGVLLDDATMREKALKLGIISTTKDALTPSQKVLAAQALIFDQTADAQGDFARTSDGLANKQRILAAQIANLKTRIGEGLLPTVLRVTTIFSTQLLPIFEKYGPGAVRKLGSALGELVGGIIAFGAAFKANDGDITSSGLPGVMERLGFAARQVFDFLVPIFREIRGSVLAFVAAFRAADGDITSSGLPGVMERLGFVARKAFDVAAEGARWLAQNWETIRSVVTAVLPPLAAAWAGFVAFQKITAAIAAVKAFGLAIKGVSLALLANPVGLVVAGIAAVAAGLWVAYRRSETFRNAVNTLAATVKAWWDGVVATFRSDGLTAAIAKAWDGIREGATAVLSWLQSTGIPWLRERAADLARTLGEWIGPAAAYLRENLPIWLAALGDWLAGTALPWLGEQAAELARKLGGWIGDAWNYLRDNLPGWIREFTAWFISTAIPWLVEHAAKLAAKLADWVTDSSQQLLRNLPGWLAAIGTWIATEALPAMLRFGAQLGKWLQDGLWEAIGFAADIGKAIVQGIIDGIWSLAGKLASSVKQFISDNIPGPVRSLLGISSPSKVMFDLGVWTMKGLEAGIESRQANVQTYMTQAVAAPSQFQAVRSGAAAASALPAPQATNQGGPLTVQLTLDGRVLARQVIDEVRVLERGRR